MKDRLRPRVGQFNPIVLAALLIVGLIAVFYLPYFVRVSPTVSASYTFGYNNRVGILSALLLATCVAVYSGKIPLPLKREQPSKPVPVLVLICSLLVVLAGCSFMYLLAGRLGGFGESGYEIDRSWLLSIGKTPYVDFEWPFGVIFLHGPLLIHSMFSVTLLQGYYAFWTLNFLLGTWLLYRVINMIHYPTPSKTSIFLLVYGSGLIAMLMMGTHYTSLRYTLPLFLILVVEQVVKQERGWKFGMGCLLAVLSTALLLMISPEMAIAFAFACVFILLPLRPWSKLGLGLYVGTVMLLVCVFFAALKLHVLDTMRASGGGADSFPILPAPHILMFLLALCICACFIYRRWTGEVAKENTAGLVVFSIPMIAAALGRCDPSHVAWNGEALFICSMFYLSNWKTPWKIYRVCYFLFLVALPAYGSVWMYKVSLGQARNLVVHTQGKSLPDRLMMHLARSYTAMLHGQAKTPSALAKRAPDASGLYEQSISLATIYPEWHGEFLAPFGYRPNGTGTLLSALVDYGHYEGFENANTTAAITTKMNEISDQPAKALLLPDDFENQCLTDAGAQRMVISDLFSVPYSRKAVHLTNLRKPICDLIVARYVPLKPPNPENFGYGLWVAQDRAFSLTREGLRGTNVSRRVPERSQMERDGKRSVMAFTR